MMNSILGYINVMEPIPFLHRHRKAASLKKQGVPLMNKTLKAVNIKGN